MKKEEEKDTIKEVGLLKLRNNRVPDKVPIREQGDITIISSDGTRKTVTAEQYKKMGRKKK